MERVDDQSPDRGAEGGASDTSHDEVRRRAYERYMARGGEGGSDMDDWLAAEREVRGARAGGAGMADRPEALADMPGSSGTGPTTSGGRGVPDDAPRSADEAMSATAGTDSATLSGMEGVIADEPDAGTSAKTSRAPRTRSGRGRRAD